MTLKTLLKKNGFSQSRFGELLGVGQTAVSNWCNGTNQASASKIGEMAKVLGVSADEIISAMEESKNEKEERKNGVF